MLARTVNFEPPIFARLVTAALAFLCSVSGIAILVRDLVEGAFGGFSAAAGLIGLLALACGVGQAGGVIRIVSGVSEGDPLWARLRSAR
ncbi:hypothetical protein ACGGZK_18670 [Agromyces sp. MMS24-K17]|uniref:hypothetical protein n=1 Tax=Agromyces sp. MMS24-K17 TaxID=3372850 RepID=UPI003754F029